MTRIPTEQNQTIDQLLRDILHNIAVITTPQDNVNALLGMLQTMTNAQACAYKLVKDSELVIAVGFEDDKILHDEALDQFVRSYEGPITLFELDSEDYARVLAIPLTVADSVVGLLVVCGDETLKIENDTFDVIIDGFTILTRQFVTQARHERTMRNQREFIRTVSHDLRSPLTSMRGYASMLESGDVGDINEQQALFIEKILSGITQMTNLVENIQDAGRYDPQTGFYEMQRTHCDLVEIVNKIVNNHLVPAEKQALTIYATLNDVPIINADRHMLERAVTNLVDNAIKYTPNGGEIEVGLRSVDDAILISVRDTGYGISEVHQKSLFERHVRIPREEHRRVKGSGLGLFIVKSVAQHHNGNAWIESIEGEGSTFLISIPLNGANLPVPGE